MSDFDLKDINPALIAIAVTSKPHLRQRGNEITIFKKGEKDYVRIPAFRLGVYNHPRGSLVLNEAIAQKMIQNHRAMVTDFGESLDFRHTDKEGTLAFLSSEDGGYLELGSDKWLYACGPVTDEESRKLIESRKWRYASPEIDLSYKSNLAYTLESPEEPIKLNELEFVGDTMSKKTITFGTLKLEMEAGDDGVYRLTNPDVVEQAAQAHSLTVTEADELKKKVDQQAAALTKAQEEIEALKKLIPSPEVPPTPVDPRVAAELTTLKEQNRILLEANRATEDRRLKDRCAFALEKAAKHTDGKGYGHSPIFLNLLRAGLMLQPFEFGADKETIKLESQSDPADVVAYFRNLLLEFAERVPGQVLAEQRTQTHDERPGDVQLEYTDKDMQESVEEYKSKF